MRISTMTKILHHVVFILCMSYIVNSYEIGAPPEACSTMMPKHDSNKAMNDVSGVRIPYQIILSKNQYSPNDKITVTIRGPLFKGFLIQARKINRNQPPNPIGTFTVIPSTKIVCQGAYGSGLTHTRPLDVSQIQLQWNAPANAAGHIEFRVTVVERFNRIWKDLQSAILTDPTSRDLPEPEPVPMDPILQISTVGKCGWSKGCFKSPPNCVEENCDYLLTYTPSKNYIDFEMSGKTNGWVAVGFSKDKKMGDDSVIECVYNTDTKTVSVKNSYNVEDGKSNVYLSKYNNDDYLSNMQGYYFNNRISCRFRRERKSQNDKIFSLDQPYYLFMSKGPSKGGFKDPHPVQQGDYPLISADPVNVNDVAAGSGQARWPAMKCHGILMILAWVLFVGIGMIIAHQYKEMWMNSWFQKERYWFQIHRAVMITAVILTIISFIIIFIAVGGYSNFTDLPNKAHPIIGIVTLILVILNPLITLCRCTPDHKDRPVFNWFHWFIGTAAHILAVVNIFLGFDLPRAGVPWYCSWIMVAYVIFHCLVDIILEIHNCCYDRKNRDKNDKDEKQEEWEMMKLRDPNSVSDRRPEPSKKWYQGGRGFRYFMLAIYVVLTLCFTTVMVLIIAIA